MSYNKNNKRDNPDFERRKIMKAKKLLAVVLALMLGVALTACGGGTSGGNSGNGEISVFYYTYSDTYISSVRSAMDKLLAEKEYHSKTMMQTETRQRRQNRLQLLLQKVPNFWL